MRDKTTTARDAEWQYRATFSPRCSCGSGGCYAGRAFPFQSKLSERLIVTPEHVRLEEEYYLLASAHAQRRPQVLLNHAESFAICDLAGDIPLAYRDSYGLFHRGTRFLHRYELRLNGKLPLLLSTTTTHEGSGLVTHLTNADELRDGEVSLLRDTVAVRRDKTLLGESLYERVQLQNYGQEQLHLELDVLFGADFADIFELRGSQRAQRGEALAPKLVGDGVRLPY